MGSQVSDEIGNSTLINCGFTVNKGEKIVSEQGPQTIFGPIPDEASSSSALIVATLLQDQLHLQEEFAGVKQKLMEEQALNAKRHEDLLSSISVLIAKLTSPPS